MSKRTSLIVALVVSLTLLLFVSVNLFSTFFNDGESRTSVTTIDTDSSSTGNFSGMGHMMGGRSGYSPGRKRAANDRTAVAGTVGTGFRIR